MMFFKKTVYDKLLTKVNAIDTRRFVLITDNSDLEKKNQWRWQKIPDTSGFAKKNWL